VPDEEWLPPERYRGERPDLEAEARRLVALTREAQMRREILERKLRDRLNGRAYVDAGEWLEQADAEREQANGSRTYPRAWEDLAALARQIPRPKIGRPRRGRYDKGQE
jgi:hypothetical protein